MLLPLALFSLCAHAGDDTAMVGVIGPEVVPLIEARAVALGGRVERCFEASRVCILRFPGMTRPPLDELSALPGVRYAEQDRPMDGVRPVGPSLPPVPSDAEGTDDCPDPWELETIGAPEAWERVDGTWAPVVAVQDSGFLLEHMEIQGRVSGQYDYGNGDNDPEIEWGSSVPAHGTFIGGVIAADPDNGRGRAGVAPYGQLNLQKIADDDGALYFSYAVWALGDLADGDLGVGVLNYSIAGSSYTSAFYDAVAALEGVGILMVVAAGNCGSAHCSDADNDANPMYPGNFDLEHVVTVASSTRDDGFNSYSHYGQRSVDLAAPGEDICSCGAYGIDDFYTSGGTSYATPLVAASAALIMEAHPDLTTTEVARVLRASAEDVPAWEDKVRSGGRLDLAAALATAVPRMDAVADVAIDGEGVLSIDIDNPGDPGEVWLVLEHPEAFDVARVEDLNTDQRWTLERFDGGSTVELPDAGALELPDGVRVAVAHGPVGQHASASLQLTLRGREVGSWDASARVAMVSDGADYLNAPYDVGDPDSTGFLALGFQVRVTDASADTGWEDTGLATDSDEPGDSTPAEDTGPVGDTGADEPGGCGCGGGAAGGGLLGLLGLGLVVRRRSGGGEG